jgi:hypothetical protein
MAYTTINKSTEHFNTKLWPGTGSSPNALTGVGFKPDWTWIKSKSTASHFLYDSIRGVSKYLLADDTGAEGTNGYLSSFDTDGITLGSTSINVNASGTNYASWNWKANGTSSVNYSGTVDSTVSVNTTSGFSIVSWIHNGNANYTVGHGLGATPRMIFAKTRSSSANWDVYQAELSTGNRLILNSTGGQVSGYWGANTVNNNTFSVGSALASNGTTMIAYCFAEKQGFSKTAVYTGNGSATNGTFVYTGFKPAFVMIKHYTGGGNDWIIKDNKSPGSNVTTKVLFPNADYSEGNGAYIDLLSNGFKLRNNEGNSNDDGTVYLYLAFGQTLVGTNNIPNNAF